ncbi:hypothetical protein CMV30_15600 [Nibricoccus aquaticus]|uniref:Uncharacterized protein n=1 Tax=Nibricoccus aquaticus TaxID=2576891 RepID=A0A290QLE8_9BACT|nr:hypothetical protein [Nibricoccus aquaticus]ATC65261.1 hypothetical protein CMV30_15600 [Nibricoccus aquaticus]
MENQPLPPPLASLKPSAAKPYPGPDTSSPRGNGRGWILALAILQAIGGIVVFAITQGSVEPHVAGIMLVFLLGLSAIYVGLWIWGKKAPFAALLTALIIFLTVHLLDAVFEPANLFRGIIVKVILVAGLSTALKKAYTKKREAELEASQS